MVRCESSGRNRADLLGRLPGLTIGLSDSAALVATKRAESFKLEKICVTQIYAEGRAKWKNMTQPNIVSHNPRNRQRGQTSEYRLVISTIIILKHARFLPNYI
jgi:hypothetical protein